MPKVVRLQDGILWNGAFPLTQAFKVREAVFFKLNGSEYDNAFCVLPSEQYTFGPLWLFEDNALAELVDLSILIKE